MTNLLTITGNAAHALQTMPTAQKYALAFLVIGYLLSEGSKLVWAIIIHLRRKSRVRRIIRYEIGHNLSLLRELWNQVLAEKPARPEVEYIARCNQLIRRPFPAFHDQAFLSESSNIASYLSKRRIEALLHFYSRLEALREFRTMIQSKSEQENENWRLASKGTNKLHFDDKDKHWDLPASPFSEQSQYLFEEAKGIVEPLLKAGNIME
ncbi:MAG: hypothetical protein A2X46_04435 [Lentisphaerae bacterium GWF2_57_35]|nr:MAG: hypothetical protein A2X46_04435 [Lentisphaerae bacterium GWF2_57_35]